MKIVDDDDRELVAKALTLYERIDLYRREPTAFTTPTPTDEDALFDEWKELFDHLGDETAFDRRLRFENLDQKAARAILGRLELPENFPLPEWMEIVRAVLTEMASAPPSEKSPYASVASEPIPFVEYWTPWIAIATRRVGPAWSTLHEEVQAGFLRALIWDLSTCGARTLMHEFDVQRAMTSMGTGNDLFFTQLNALKKQTPARATSRYRAFIKELQQERASSFLKTYPGLARLAATRVLLFAQHVSEIIERLTKDRAAIEHALKGDHQLELGDWVGIEADLSDSHNGGRRVARLDFASGLSIAYKPKDVGTEVAFQTLVERVNKLGFEPPLRTVTIVARADYGWVEWVLRKPIQNEQELAHYHARCGALLALVTFLRGADCHFENIVANGSQPVLVDHEVVLAPELLSSEATSSSAEWEAIHQRLVASVISTGLLPQWSVEVDGTVIDLSGIGARRVPRAKQRLVLANLNSDDMVLETTTDMPAIAGAEPDFAEELSSASAPRRRTDFEEHHVVTAYETVAGLVLGLSTDDRLALFAGFDGLVTRHVLRSTLGYAHLLRESRKPELLCDGLRRTIALDRIARIMLVSMNEQSEHNTEDGNSEEEEERPAAWPVVRAEHEAIGQGDIPTFYLRSNELAIFARDSRDAHLTAIAPNVFRTSGIVAMERELRSWSRDDLAIERRLIRCSFSGKAAGLPTSSSSSEHADDGAKAPEQPFDDARAVDEALRIARSIAANAITFRGQRYHLGLEREEPSSVHQVALLGPNLYGGTTGIALFLGAAAHVAKDEALRVAAIEALGPVRAEIRRDPNTFVSSTMPKLGAFEGIGGLIYTFARLFSLSNGAEPSLIDDARLLTNAITERHITEAAAAGLNDVFSGTAGLLLAQLALDKIASPPPPSQGENKNHLHIVVERCALALVRHARREATGIGWPLRPEGRSLCGFAHGNAGIAVALVEASRVAAPSNASRREFRDAAVSALAYERSLRDDEQKNWPDLRSVDLTDTQSMQNAPFMATWCNGAPGIALGRLRIARIADEHILDDLGLLRDVREDLALAIETTKTASHHLPMGHLCCGTAGVEEILFEVGTKNNDAALIEIARRRMMARIEKDSSTSPLVMENLMRGTAGVGLTLLRMSQAGRDVACVLDLSV